MITLDCETLVTRCERGLSILMSIVVKKRKLMVKVRPETFKASGRFRTAEVSLLASVYLRTGDIPSHDRFLFLSVPADDNFSSLRRTRDLAR